MAVISSLCSDGDATIFSDELNHASIIDGARLASRSNGILQVSLWALQSPIVLPSVVHSLTWHLCWYLFELSSLSYSEAILYHPCKLKSMVHTIMHWYFKIRICAVCQYYIFGSNDASPLATLVGLLLATEQDWLD